MKTKKKLNIGIILFARLGSTRLPNKIFYKINNTYILDIIYRNIKSLIKNHKIVIATSKNKIDKKIVLWAQNNNIEYFIGSEKNVYLRAISCCKKFKFDAFVRVCCDMPLLNPYLLKKMLNIYISKNLEIVTNCLQKTYPKGLTCEIINTKVFIKNYKKTNFSEKEHIVDFFYKNKNNFKIKNINSNFPKKLIKYNLSVDTLKDIIRIKKIFKHFKKNLILFSDLKKFYRIKN